MLGIYKMIYVRQIFFGIFLVFCCNPAQKELTQATQNHYNTRESRRLQLAATGKPGCASDLEKRIAVMFFPDAAREQPPCMAFRSWQDRVFLRAGRFITFYFQASFICAVWSGVSSSLHPILPVALFQNPHVIPPKNCGPASAGPQFFRQFRTEDENLADSHK